MNLNLYSITNIVYALTNICIKNVFTIFFQQIQKNGDISPTSDNRRLFPLCPAISSTSSYATRRVYGAKYPKIQIVLYVVVAQIFAF